LATFFLNWAKFNSILWSHCSLVKSSKVQLSEYY
jgi:hypothetical protein